jgi:hypothetical protein
VRRSLVLCPDPRRWLIQLGRNWLNFASEKKAESRLVRPPDRCRVLPWKIRGKGGACAIACDAKAVAPLPVIFARRQDARRGEDGSVTCAGVVIRGCVTAGGLAGDECGVTAVRAAARAGASPR